MAEPNEIINEVAQTVTTTSSFETLMQGPLGTIVYSVLGFTLMWLFLGISGLLTKFSIKKEIVEDENVALGIMFGCGFIGVAIIIAASIAF